MADFEVIVVGAGLSGIVAAARYLQRHPQCNITILEQDYCLGGVWSARRIYPSFWTQWAYGIAEFADFPMVRPPEEDCMNDLFRAKYTLKYLEDYANHVHAAGRSLRDRIQFNINVQSIEKRGSRWFLTCSGPNGKNNTLTLTASLLMMANGQTSIPRLPDLPGQELFQGIIVHSVDFGQSDVIKNDKVQHVAVLGGGKSAADMVYESVKAGKTVSWIIRKTGDDSAGPGFFAPPDVPTPYRNPGFAAQTRAMASLQPCFLMQDNMWSWFLHRTRYGVKLVKWIFDQADKTIRNRAAYKERKSTKGFEKLEYETDLFWQNGVGGVLHHSDFYPLVAENVDVYRASVKKLIKNELYLDDGAHFRCDAVLCGTGWQRGLDMFSDDLKIQLGLPYSKELLSLEDANNWEALVADADKTICNRFHILRKPPPHPHVEESRTPYRLYRGMAPLHDSSILFMNHVTIANKIFGAEAQAIWAVAYFDSNFRVPTEAEREQDVATWIAWNRRRYLSNGSLANSVVFDGVPYVDSLLQEIGLSAHRQKGWLRNWFAPFLPADLGKAWAEYLNRSQK